MKRRPLTKFLKGNRLRMGLKRFKIPLSFKSGALRRGRRLRKIKWPKIYRKYLLRALMSRLVNSFFFGGKKSKIEHLMESLKLFYYFETCGTYFWYTRYPVEHLIRYTLWASSSYIQYNKLKLGYTKVKLIPRFRSIRWGYKQSIRLLSKELKLLTLKRSFGAAERINMGLERLLDTECAGLLTRREENKRLLREARHNRHFRWWRD